MHLHGVSKGRMSTMRRNSWVFSASSFFNSSNRLAWDSCRFLQPRKSVLVIFGPKKGGTQGQLAAWILRFQLKIFLEIWNCLRRIVPEGRSGPHRIVVICILRFELHCLFERTSSFRNEAQVHTHKTKIIMETGIAGLQVPRVGQVAKGSLIVLL